MVRRSHTITLGQILLVVALGDSKCSMSIFFLLEKSCIFFDNTHIYRKSNHIKVIRPVKTLFVQAFVQILISKCRDTNH